MVANRSKPRKGINAQAEARLEERDPSLKTCVYF